ncbi:hypothetical protein [Paenibacillus bovis]|uniref:Uncharacterized protein n=1 Tax=Paenibacillus bovis TaxID=1616788 RepID=A0A172ZCL3_9BACL|nr:hypothetical protein [Paenibacillus bovis]ANF95386.1 hypothetical protein AR543_04720 [Paenibacillus bovis]
MNITKSQAYIELTIASWENTSLGATLAEIVRRQRQYQNDYVEVHQVVELFKTEDKADFLVILNVIRDVDNPGDPVPQES